MSDAHSPSVIVVTPVYEDREASSRLFTELGKVFGSDVFVVAVDDGSLRQPVEASAYCNASIQGQILRLRRNVGHQRAIAIGLAHVSEWIADHQRVVVMDSDGEDVPVTIPALLAALDNPNVDAAVAHRKSRVETLKFKAFYAIYKRIFKALTGRKISFGNFMALKANAVKRMAAMQELPIHAAGCLLASRLRTEVCPLDRGPRYAGQSKMNFVGLVLHGFRGMMVFAEDVVVRVGIACGVIAGMAVFLAALAVLLRLCGYSSPGWFSIALGILVLMFFQMGALALMTLMLTGNRGSFVVPKGGYRDIVESVINVLDARHPEAPLAQ